MEQAQRLLKLPTYVFARLDQLKAEERKKGVDLIDLGMGNPNVPPPKEVTNEMIKALQDPENHRYPSFEGNPKFVKAVISWCKRQYGIEIKENEGRVAENTHTGRILIDGKGIGDVGRSVLRERKILSEDGIVVVVMAFDEETGVVVYGPDIVSRGFVFWTETGHLLDDAQCVILEVVEEVGPEVPDRAEVIRTKLQTLLRQYFYFTIRRRPTIIPVILEL